MKLGLAHYSREDMYDKGSDSLSGGISSLPSDLPFMLLFFWGGGLTSPIYKLSSLLKINVFLMVPIE